MERSTEDLLVRVSSSRHPIENLLVQFTVLSLVIMAILGVVLSVILTTRLNRDFELLKENTIAAAELSPTGAVPGVTVPDLEADLRNLTWTTYVAIGGGFAILYAGLVWIFWRGWKTIDKQQDDLLKSNTELRAAYHDLQEAQDGVVRTERLAAIGQLSAGVAHDLRNPLGAIKNAVYYVKGKLRDSETQKENPRIGEFLEIMEEEVDASDQILTDLMDFARVNRPQRAPTQLESVVDNAIQRFQTKDTVKVVKEFDAGLPEVPADREQLRRAFGNLIKNADEAMPDGGLLKLTGRAVDSVIELGFQDTGEGIESGELRRVMDPLFTTKSKGIGLGLAIVNMVVERHDGKISVDSEPGKGTTFTIRLPIDDNAST